MLMWITPKQMYDTAKRLENEKDNTMKVEYKETVTRELIIPPGWEKVDTKKDKKTADMLYAFDKFKEDVWDEVCMEEGFQKDCTYIRPKKPSMYPLVTGSWYEVEGYGIWKAINGFYEVGPNPNLYGCIMLGRFCYGSVHDLPDQKCISPKILRRVTVTDWKEGDA